MLTVLLFVSGAISIDATGAPGDVLFVFDRSSSEVTGYRESQRGVATQIVATLGARISSSSLRVAAVSYSGASSAAKEENPGRVHFDFSDSFTASGVKDLIDDMDLTTELEWTDASTAFKVARTDLVGGGASVGYRGGAVPILVVFFTDGEVRSFEQLRFTFVQFLFPLEYQGLSLISCGRKLVHFATVQPTFIPTAVSRPNCPLDAWRASMNAQPNPQRECFLASNFAGSILQQVDERVEERPMEE
jgi:hypothetical protein